MTSEARQSLQSEAYAIKDRFDAAQDNPAELEMLTRQYSERVKQLTELLKPDAPEKTPLGKQPAG